MSEHVSETELDAVVARAFGRADDGPAHVELVGRFREAGLCEESAEQAARGLESRSFFSFEDAALAVVRPWGDDIDSYQRRTANRAATPERIGEVARKLQGSS